MATKKTPQQETTVRVETVGVEEIADAVEARWNKSPVVKELGQRIGQVHRSARSDHGRLLNRVKKLEAENRHMNRDIDALYKIVSDSNSGVTVTRRRPSRTN